MSRSGSQIIQPVEATPEQDAQNLGLCTPMERMFAEEMLADYSMNITRAAEKAGYRNPAVTGYAVLKRPRVLQQIGSLIQKRIKARQVTQTGVLDELCKLAYTNPKRTLDADGHVADLKDIPDDVAAAISRFEIEYEDEKDAEGNLTGRAFRKVKVWFWSKEEALAMLAKHVGLYQDLVLNQQFVSVNWADLHDTISRLAGWKCPRCGYSQEEHERKKLEEDPVEKRIEQAKQIKAVK